MKYLCIVLYLLILPIVSAQTIVSFSGNDRVDGYARPVDDVTIVATGFIAGSPPEHIARERMRILVDGSEQPMTSCTRQGAQYRCVFSEQLVDAAGQKEYTVRILSADNSIISATSAVVTIDEHSPRIVDFAITPPVSATNNFTFLVHAQDYALMRGDVRTCSGIRDITFTVDGQRIQQLPGANELCNLDRVFPFTFEGRRGAMTVCAFATDQFGQSSEEMCADVTFDRDPPEVLAFGFSDGDSVVLRHVQSSGKTLSPAVQLSDARSITDVTLDVSAITGIRNDIQRPLRIIDDTYLFEPLDVTPQTDCQAIVSARDDLGNVLEQNVSCQVEADDTPPQFVRIQSNYEDVDGKPIVGRRTDLDVVMEDTGAGLQKAEVFLDLAPLGLDRVMADECRKDDAWICTFRNITPINEGDFFLTVSARDDAGNSMADDEDVIQVTLDAPVITKIEQSPKFVTANDQLEYVLTVQSVVDIRAFVRASDMLSTDVFPNEGSCEIQSAAGEWICIVSIGSLSNEYIQDIVTFEIQDTVGNIVRETRDVTVYEVAEQGDVNFFSVTRVFTSPRRVDRTVASQIAYPFYIRPQLRQLDTSNIEILDAIVSCDSPHIVDGPTLLYANTKSPYIAMKLDTDVSKNLTSESIDVDCQMELVIKRDEAVFPTTEKENFTGTVQFENLPLGTIDQNIRDKLDGIDAEIQSIERDIDKWEGINEALGGIRDTASLVAQVDASLSIVTSVVWVVASILFKTPVSGAGSALWEATCGAYVGEAGSTGLHHLINIIVWYPGHLPGSIVLPTPKNAAIIQSCQLCGFTNVIKIAIPQSQGEIIADIDDDAGKPTTLEALTTYEWEPFKSIHVAQACLCPPAIEYNLRKERQIRCIYRNCVEEAARLGLPFSHCDQTLLEQNCLYVDGAAWKVAGGSAMASIMRDLLANVLGVTPVMQAGTVWTALCNPFYSVLGEQAYSCQSKGGDPFVDWAVPLCGAWSAGLEIAETDFFGENKFGWDTFNGRLEGENFCVD